MGPSHKKRIAALIVVLAVVGGATTLAPTPSEYDRVQDARIDALCAASPGVCPTPTPSPTPVPTPSPTPSPTPAPTPGSLGFPIRAAFYYPWFPESWNQSGINPFTWYHPTRGFYDTNAVVGSQVAEMEDAGLQAGIASWWGQGTPTDGRVPNLLAAAGSGFRWSLYYEAEGTSDPSSTQINSDVTYILAHYGSNPAYLRVGGKPVIFVYGGGPDACSMADRWKAGNAGRAYIVLKVFAGYAACASQPDSWHQYAPAAATDHQPGYSFSISPGFFKRSESTARLGRDLTRWAANVAAMKASNEPWQLLTTYNEWGEGTMVESSTEFGNSYLNTFAGQAPAPSASPTPTGPVATPTPTPVPTPTPTPAPTPTPTPAPGGSVTIAAAGDIACDPASNTGAPSNCDQAATANLILGLHPTAVLTLGDHQYEDNTTAKYGAVFNPTWGQFKSLIHPAIGNHEYLTANAAGYFGYFGAAAGSSSKGYYSYDIGAWHFISLNSECSHIGGCASGNPQEVWLRNDLATHSNACTLAYWHEPRWSNGEHGNATQMTTIWNDLVAGHADIVLSGHNHDYERYGLMSATGALSSTGVREFVVGTGGKNHYAITAAPLAAEQVSNDKTFGVLQLTLSASSYAWNFRPAAGYSFTDSGTDVCH